MAAFFEDLDYLYPGFDLTSLTVPRLRYVLVSHNIPYPTSAKKAQLIAILQAEVLPRANELLSERERVRRTSVGITNMASRETSVASNSDYGGGRDSLPPPPTPSTASTTRRGRPSRSARASTADTDRTDATTVSRRRTTARRVRPSEEETGNDAAHATPPATTRKLRSSEVAPPVEDEGNTPRVKVEVKDENVFSDDNPFQRGSPSFWGGRHETGSVSHDGKRKHSSRWSTPSLLKDEWKPRKSTTPTTPTALEPGSASTSFGMLDSNLEVPEEELEDEGSQAEDLIVAGEEFTPEEQLALDKEHAELLDAAKGGSRARKPQGTASKVVSWSIILAILLGFAMWWRKEKIEIGFCGVGKPTWSLAETKVPEWANVLQPHCEICPPHAFCYPNFTVRCEHDFILKPHPLSLGGLIPLPPTCEPDSLKARRVKAVSLRALEELRARRAEWECGGTDLKSPDMREPELKAEIAKKRRRGMSDAEFDDLWKGALGEITGKDEVVTTTERYVCLVLPPFASGLCF